MTEGMWIALISSTSIPAALSAIVLKMLSKQKRAIDRVDEQTSNTHDTNLRDDIDGVRDLAKKALLAAERVEATVDRLETSVNTVVSDVKGVRRDVGRLDDRDVAHAAHHDRVSAKLDQVDDKLDAHLAQAPDVVARLDALERKDRR